MICQRHRALTGVGVEADDDCLRRHAKQDVAFGDSAAGDVDDVDAGAVGVQAVERALDGFDGALHIGLDNQVERLYLTGGDAGMHILKGGADGSLPALLPDALFDELAGCALVGGDFQYVARFRHAADAEDFDGLGRGRGPYGFAAVGEHSADAPAQAADYDIVADVEFAGLHEDGRDGAAAVVYARLDDYASGALAYIRLEFADFGDDG